MMPSDTGAAGGSAGIVVRGADTDPYPSAAVKELSTIASDFSGCGTGVDTGAASKVVGG